MVQKKMGANSGLLRKTASVLLSGALVCAFAPGAAFAHYDPQYNDKLAVIGNSGDPLGGGVKVVREWDGNSIQYMGYAHGDGSHYKGYSVYTDITVDDDGILTALDITSGTDTFAGKWGYNNVVVEGLLPKGVSFSATQDADDADGNAVWVPVLSGADAYGYALSSVTLLSVNATGDADAKGIDQNFDNSRQIQVGRNKVPAPKYTSTTATVTNGKITVPKTVTAVATENTTETATFEDTSYYNLVKCTYTLGTEADKTQFNTYFMTGGQYVEGADGYLDNLAPTAYAENPTTGYTTNRDGWTSIMGTMVLRQLGSWGAYLADPSASTGDLDGEIESVDTVSGATKTSYPFIYALNAAKDAGYIKGVSENVQLTIDGANAADAASLPSLRINNDAENNSFQDYVTVTKSDDGLYTVKGGFNKTGAGGRLSLDAIYLVGMDGTKLGTQGIMAMAKEIINRDDSLNPFAGNIKASYMPEKFNITGEPHLVSFGARQNDMTPASSFNVSNTETVELDGNVLDFSYKKTSDSTFDFEMKIKNSDVTHVVMTYTLGHAKASSAYDLAEQLKVPGVSELMAAATSNDSNTVTAAREAFEALTYDVRPYTTGINNLQKAEAELVAKQFESLDLNDSDAVAAAFAAYDKLDAAAKAKIDASSMQKIADAQQACTIGSAKLAQTKVTYNGKAQAPAVTVTAADGKTVIDAANYDVKYANNTNAGTATVTVTGKGACTGSATAKFTITKAVNPLKATPASKQFKAKKLKKKKASVTIKATGAQGKVTYTLDKKAKKAKMKVTAKGKVTIKKGTKKGTYKITVMAAGNANYNAATKTVTVKVK